MNIDFETLYEKYFRDVYLFLLVMSKEPHIAEEISKIFGKNFRKLQKN